MTDERTDAVQWDGKSIDMWQRLWRVPELHVYTRTTSTNDDARDFAENGAPPGTTVIANEQSAGRGQAGRRWHGNAYASIHMSVILRPIAAPGEQLEFGTIPIRVGLAVARAIRHVTDLPVRLKWPNDVVLSNGRKLAGVLCEGSLASEGGSYVIAGIGVNVSQDEKDLPFDLRATAASLKSAGATSATRADVIAAILGQLAQLRGGEARPLSQQELDEVRSIDLLSGRHVTIDGHARGIADGLAPDGALLLREGDTVATIRTGCVRLFEEKAQ